MRNLTVLPMVEPVPMPGTRLDGKILNLRGRPVRDVRIRMRLPSFDAGGILSYETTSDAFGRYAVGPLPRHLAWMTRETGVPCTVRYEREGFPPRVGRNHASRGHVVTWPDPVPVRVTLALSGSRADSCRLTFHPADAGRPLDPFLADVREIRGDGVELPLYPGVYDIVLRAGDRLATLPTRLVVEERSSRIHLRCADGLPAVVETTLRAGPLRKVG